MAIPGYVRKRLARLGKIKLGPPVRKDSSEHPKDLDYFRVPEEVAAVYGEQPTSLDVRVPSSDIEKFCPITLQRWNTQQKKLCGSLDSVTAHEWQDAAGGFVEIECVYKDCEHYRSGSCVEVGDLYLVLYKVDIGGVYHIATKSINGLGYIYNEFETFAKEFNDCTGDPNLITRVNFTLSRVPEITTPFIAKLGKRVSSTHAMLHLRTTDRLTDDKAKALARHFHATQQALGAGVEVPALPSADDEDGGDVIDAEFEHDEECPADLVPGASPVGPDLAQKSQFAAICVTLGNVNRAMAALFPDMAKTLKQRWNSFEATVARAVNSEASKFDDLAGETEAPAAVKLAGEMVAQWQEELDAARNAEAAGEGDGEGATEAEVEPEAEPEPAVDTRAKHGDPTAPPAATRTRSKGNSNGGGRNLGI